MNDIIWLTMRRMRTPLILLILVYSLSVFGLAMIPGEDEFGNAVRITFLAEQLIRLAGKEPGKDIQIVYTGLRPGEKLFEQLFHELEPYETTQHEKIFLAHPRQGNWENLSQELHSAEAAVRRYDTRKLKHILLRLVPEMARTPISTRPGAAAEVAHINRPADQ